RGSPSTPVWPRRSPRSGTPRTVAPASPTGRAGSSRTTPTRRTTAPAALPPWTRGSPVAPPPPRRQPCTSSTRTRSDRLRRLGPQRPGLQGPREQPRGVRVDDLVEREAVRGDDRRPWVATARGEDLGRPAHRPPAEADGEAPAHEGP